MQALGHRKVGLRSSEGRWGIRTGALEDVGVQAPGGAYLKQQHVPPLAPTRRPGQAALHPAPSAGAAPAAPIGLVCWPIGAVRAALGAGAAREAEPHRASPCPRSLAGARGPD